CCNSRLPAHRVVRDKPVAWATRAKPPRGKLIASQAAHCRRMRSFMSGRNSSYLCRMTSIWPDLLIPGQEANCVPSVQVNHLQFQWGGSHLYAGGSRSAPEELGAPGPDHVPF